MQDHQPYALFRDDKRGESRVFAEPREIVTACTADEVLSALARLEKARRDGFWLAGFLSYEAGYVFEEKLRPLIVAERETPLIAIGIFEAPAPADHPLAAPPDELPAAPLLTEPRAAWDLEAYRTRFERLHEHLRRGDCYQANLTMPVTARWSGDPRAAFWSLVSRQPPSIKKVYSSPPNVSTTRAPAWICVEPATGNSKLLPSRSGVSRSLVRAVIRKPPRRHGIS